MKDTHVVVGKKMTQNGLKMAIYKFSEFFLPKLKKNGNQKNVFYVVAFDLFRI